MEYAAVAMVCAAGVLVYLEIAALKKKIEHLEKQLHQLAELTGYKDLPFLLVSKELKKEVIQLKRSGNIVEAVKKIREATQTGLLEAKQYIDTL